ncbi:MAG: MOSC N-terminal beta barrel domain-containing protein [Acidimicrobiales bacterium]
MQVVALWCHPVKSMVGWSPPTSAVGSDGLVGDRHWAVRDDETGRFLTARREPALLQARATNDGADAVHLHLPGRPVCTVATGDEDARGRADDELCRWLGRPVSLVEARADLAGTYEVPLDAEREADWVSWEGPAGRFHDSTRSSVSLVTTGSLRDWAPARFRTNVVLAGEDGDEDALVGSHVRLGSAVVEVTKRIDRCVMVTRPQLDGIVRDLDVLRTVNRERDRCLAVGALVVTPGTVACGDHVVVDG